MFYITVSAKVRRELYLKLKEYGISVSDVIRRALEEEVGRCEEEELSRALEEAQRILRRIPEESMVDAIRKSREEG